jgi:hypothetical protein
MKQIINLSILTLVLSIPFALSQTRKAIPAGRYEALSGIKISHSLKTTDNPQSKDSLGLFWAEIAKNIPQGKNENSFYSIGNNDTNFKNFLINKGVFEAKSLDSSVNVLLSDNFTRDNEIFKKMKAKGSLIVLKDKHGLKEVLSSSSRFDVILYQADADNNYYVMKLR